jgi:hypothetical protein
VRLLSVLSLAVLLAGAGCLSQTQTQRPSETVAFPAVVPPVPDFDFSTVVDTTHTAHELPELHTAGHGLDLVGHASIQQILPLGVRGSITAIDIWGHYAVVSGMEGGLAFAIVDIADPANPKAVGWAPSQADGWTARFSGDGNYVFYGCQMAATASTPTNPGQVVGTCTDTSKVHVPYTVDPGSDPAGVSVWNVTDKAHPKYVAFTSIGGSHNIYTANIGGEDYVFTSATAILHFNRGNQTLDLLAELPGRHDITVVQHPITHDWLLFTGVGDLSIYNVNDPANPSVVYEGDSKEGWVGWHDQVLVPGLVDGRVILLLSGETGTSTAVNQEHLPDIVSVVDVTNPESPVLLSQWQPPFASAVPWNSYLYSVHEMAATPTGQVAIAWYHGGVWVIDVSTQARQGSPPILAAYQPHEAMDVVPSTFVQTPLPYVPFVWGAGWDSRGYLVVPDMHTGVYVLKPEWGLHPALDSGQ